MLEMIGSKARKPVLIGGHRYFIDKFPPFEGIEVLGDLQRIIIDPLAEVMKVRGGTGSATDAINAMQAKPADDSDEAQKAAQAETLEAVTAAVRRLSTTLDGKTLRKIAETLVRAETISIKLNDEGDAQKLEPHIMAMAMRENGVADLIELAVEVVVHNYAGFFGNFRGLLGRLKFLMGKNESEPLE